MEEDEEKKWHSSLEEIQLVQTLFLYIVQLIGDRLGPFNLSAIPIGARMNLVSL